MRVFALAECGTYAMFEAVVGACAGSEAVLVSELIGRLQPGMLLLAHRGDGSNKPGSCQLITTVLDIAQASATELAAAYARRWKIELALDELKTHQNGPRTVLLSKSPEPVLQEIWGHLCCHYAIRALMTGASRRAQPPIH